MSFEFVQRVRAVHKFKISIFYFFNPQVGLDHMQSFETVEWSKRPRNTWWCRTVVLQPSRILKGTTVIFYNEEHNGFTTASARGLYLYDLNDRTRNNGVKLIVKHFNISVARHFYPITITTTWYALPNEVVSITTVKSFKNSLDKNWTEIPPNVPIVNW